MMNNSAEPQRSRLNDMGMYAALWMELRKVVRSRIIWITLIAFLFIILICGLFMFILEDPERAKNLGLLGAKAEIFGGTADWSNFFNIVLLIMSFAGFVIFGFIFVWIFGREFGNKTVYDLLALPTSRITIVAAKIITAVYWSIIIIMLAFILMLGIGTLLGLPGWSAGLIGNGLKQLLVTGVMVISLCIPFGLVASITRGYLPATGCIFLAIILGQVFDTLGYGQYYPWTVPILYSGATESLTGTAAAPPDMVSYIIVGCVCIGSLAATGMWWRNADQT